MTATIDNHGGPRIDPETKTAITSHDWESDDSLATTIVSTVAALADTTPEELDRIYDRIDPDSLESLFEPANGATKRNAGQVSFRLDRYTVTVHASGTIVVTDSA